MTLRVLVVGPTLVREGLRALLAQDEDFTVSAAAGGSLADHTPPNVIVCCTDMPDEVLGLRARWPQAGLLVVAALSPAVAARLTKLGALGLFPLSAEPDELIWAVHSVAQGRLTLHPTALRALVAHLAATGSTPLPPPVQLTARERDVLRCLTLGASDKDIAQQLYLSVRTVQSHLARLYHKLGVHSRTGAALTAIRAGWFDETSADKNLDQFSNSTEADLRHLALVGARPD